MSLAEVYEDAWRKKYGLADSWVVNAEPAAKWNVGDIVRMDDGTIAYEATLAGRGIGSDLAVTLDLDHDDSAWSFQSNDVMQVTVAAAADAPVVSPVGEAAFDVRVDFGDMAGVSLNGQSSWFDKFADIGLVRTALVDAAHRELLFPGDCVVVELKRTGLGVRFEAEGRHAGLHARGSAKVAPGQVPPVAALAASIGVVTRSGSAREQQLGEGSVLALRALYLGRRGFFWWRRFEAFGVADEPDLDQVEETLLRPVEGEGDDEYFALLGS